jgi:hypothetical protein
MASLLSPGSRAVLTFTLGGVVALAVVGAVIAGGGTASVVFVGIALFGLLIGIFLNKDVDDGSNAPAGQQSSNDDPPASGVAENDAPDNHGEVAEGSQGEGEGEGTEGDGCFPAGTEILLAGGAGKPIEEIIAGDLVLSRNERDFQPSRRRVTQLFAHAAQPILTVLLADGARLETTPAHRFFVEGEGFIGASRLRQGMRLARHTGAAIMVAGIGRNGPAKPVYNLEVAEDHTFFVGQHGVWVHNVKITEPPV